MEPLDAGLSGAGLLHAPDGVLAAEEHAFRIDGLHLLPARDVGALDGAGTARDAGIVDHDVEPALLAQHVGQQGLPGLLGGDVVAHEAAGAVLGVLRPDLPLESCRSATTTRAPWPASSAADAAPMPEAPPVTIATCPESSPLMSTPTIASARQLQ